MKHYLRIYLFFLKSSFQLFMSHRFNFFMGAFANILWTVSQLITVNYLFTKIPSFQGWSLADLILLLSFGQVYVYVSAMIFDLNLNKLPDKIISGAFDRMLTKPINILFLSSFEQLSIATLIPMITTVTPLMLYGMINRSSFQLLDLFFATITLILGIITLYFLSLAISGLTFFFEDIQSIKEYVVMRTIDLARIPLSIFPQLIQSVLTFVIPTAFIAYYPAQIIRHQTDLFFIFFIQAFLLVIFYLTAQIIWKAGLKKYSGIG